MKKTFVALSVALMIFAAAQPASLAIVFTDTQNHWAKDVIDYCSEAEFIAGFPGNVFRPDEPLTRAQLAVIWARYNHFRTHKFTDVVMGQWHEQPIIMLYGTGVLNGTSENKFSPGIAMTREQIAAIVARTFELTPQDENTLDSFTDKADITATMVDDVSAVVYYGIMTGKDNKFSPKAAVTRAQMCQIIKNIDDYQAEQTTPPSGT